MRREIYLTEMKRIHDCSFPLWKHDRTRRIQEKVDDYVSASRKRSGFILFLVSVGFSKYGNRLFRPGKMIKAKG